MLFGLAIGLSVAFAVYVKDRVPQATNTQPVAAETPAYDNNNEQGVPLPESATTDAEPAERRFSFYEMLPDFEVVVPENKPEIKRDSEPQAVVEPGLYVLQAGSFSTNEDADRRRAELALHGIESQVHRIKINDRNYHRVYIGPTDDLDELNLLRSRLRAAQIDVFRIRLAD